MLLADNVYLYNERNKSLTLCLIKAVYYIQTIA